MGHCEIQVICCLSILFSIWCSGGAHEQNSTVCASSLKVRRNTVWRVSAMKDLKINCTVEYCNTIPNVSWCKVSDGSICIPVNMSEQVRSEWKNVTENTGILFLVFLSISMEDSGLYRCKLHGREESIGHSINVTVTAAIIRDVEVTRGENKSANSTIKSDNLENLIIPPDEKLWHIIFIAGGTASFVVMVMVITLLIIKCRGSKRQRKEKKSENQYLATPPSDLPPPVPSANHPRGKANTPQNLLSAGPPCVYDVPTSRRASQRNHPSSGGVSANQAVACNEGIYGNGDQEEENPLVYASLNHHTAPRVPVRTSLPQQEECSEYAAIRVS